MEIHEVKNSAGLAPAAFALATMPASGVATADMAVLATADQQSVETRALRIVSLPEVKEQIEASTRAFASLPPASDPEARRALRPADAPPGAGDGMTQPGARRRERPDDFWPTGIAISSV